jgi:molybdenum cofactor biosynthesis enzyme
MKSRLILSIIIVLLGIYDGVKNYKKSRIIIGITFIDLRQIIYKLN